MCPNSRSTYSCTYYNKTDTMPPGKPERTVQTLLAAKNSACDKNKDPNHKEKDKTKAKAEKQPQTKR